MTNMEKVAEMLGVKLGEEFNIKHCHHNPYHFNTDGVLDNEGYNSKAVLQGLLKGDYEIEKIQQEPKRLNITVISDVCSVCEGETSLGFIRIIEDCKIKVICEDCLEKEYGIRL